MADKNPIKLADKIMALTREASGEDFAKAVFMLKLPDGVRKTMWAEPLASWPEMKARASSLWHAEKTRSQATVYESAIGSEPGGQRREVHYEGPEEQQISRICEVLQSMT